MLTKPISKSVAKRLAIQKPKKKRKTIARLLEDAAELLQKIRRIEESDENGYCKCASCGKVDHYKNMDGGHYIPRSKTAVKINETNIHPQCRNCNHFRKEEARCPYSIFMIETYGYEYVKWLEAESRKEKKYTRGELEEIIIGFKARLKEIE